MVAGVGYPQRTCKQRQGESTRIAAYIPRNSSLERKKNRPLPCLFFIDQLAC